MVHDGIKFRADRNIVRIPLPTTGTSGYAYFGRVCEPDTPGAVQTKTKRDRKYLWAKPIPCEGHSKSNMMYGPNNKTYLCVNGRCYVG